MQLPSLFKKKINLNRKKYRLINSAECAGLSDNCVKKLKELLKDEQKINKELSHEIKGLSKLLRIKSIEKHIKSINNITKKQLQSLGRVKVKIFKKTSYAVFKRECEKEAEQNKSFSKLLMQMAKGFDGVELPKAEIRRSEALLNQL